MWKKGVTVVALSLLSGTAMAHGGHVIGSGILAGLSHPVAGIDHLLAAVAVGLIASRHQGAERWLMPLLFSAMLAIGFVVAAPFAWVAYEASILVSLLAMSLMLFVRPGRMGGLVTMLVVGFALFHGVAHGVEAPIVAQGAYLAGLVATTLALHTTGLFAGARMNTALFRLSGVALGGATLALGIA